MKQHPLIAFRDIEHGANLTTRQSLDITKRYHLTLGKREGSDRLSDLCRNLWRHKAVLNVI